MLPMRSRFLRDFVVSCQSYSSSQGFLGAKFDAEIKNRADGIVNATIEVYERISRELLPTPARFVNALAEKQSEK